ncbi:MAG: hypothetical protein AAF799_07055 [Myxococcota bacterium]
MGNIESCTSAQASIVFNSEHYPILFVTWFGMPTSAVVHGYTEWLGRMAERARREGNRFVVIGDTTDMGGRPGPETRRVLAEGIDRVTAEVGDTFLGSLTIIDGAFMRAVITMTLYLTRRGLTLIPVRSLAEALPKAFAMLEEAGVPGPTGLTLDTYERPSHPLGTD